MWWRFSLVSWRGMQSAGGPLPRRSETEPSLFRQHDAFPQTTGLTALWNGFLFRTQLLRRFRHKPFSQNPLQDYLHVHRVVLQEGRRGHDREVVVVVQEGFCERLESEVAL